jgi:hypothetical protein
LSLNKKYFPKGFFDFAFTGLDIYCRWKYITENAKPVLGSCYTSENQNLVLCILLNICHIEKKFSRSLNKDYDNINVLN